MNFLKNVQQVFLEYLDTFFVLALIAIGAIGVYQVVGKKKPASDVLENIGWWVFGVTIAYSAPKFLMWVKQAAA